jgi:hypothetical protein
MSFLLSLELVTVAAFQINLGKHREHTFWLIKYKPPKMALLLFQDFSKEIV